jgi:hypothetical protein
MLTYEELEARYNYVLGQIEALEEENAFLRSEGAEQARLLGMSAERELALLARIESILKKWKV